MPPPRIWNHTSAAGLDGATASTPLLRPATLPAVEASVPRSFVGPDRDAHWINEAWALPCLPLCTCAYPGADGVLVLAPRDTTGTVLAVKALGVPLAIPVGRIRICVDVEQPSTAHP